MTARLCCRRPPPERGAWNRPPMTLPVKPIVVIPARLASVRLPNKPLAEIHGEPMVVHVWRRAVAAEIGPVLVACAEPEVAEAPEGEETPVAAAHQV